jgi:hypothetical protein
MIKTMFAKFPGKCCRTGAPISPGDEIHFDTFTRQAWITDEDEHRGPFVTVLDDSAPYSGRYISNIINTGSAELYQNKAGRCIDAPCCGCCNF